MPRVSTRTEIAAFVALALAVAIVVAVAVPHGPARPAFQAAGRLAANAAGEAPDGTLIELDPAIGDVSGQRLLHALDEAQDPPVLVARAVRADRSPALRTIPSIPGGGVFEDHPVKKRKPVGDHGTYLSGGTGTGRGFAPDPVVQDATAATNEQISTIVSFEGIGNRNALLPPDPSGDIGRDHYVQWVNTSLAVFDRTGVVLYGPTNGNTIWAGFGGACETYNDGDPIVQYDHLADRWLIAQFAVPGGGQGYHECIAISATPDPTGAWHRYDFLVSSKKMNDYPKFGVWADGYYMSANQFTNGRSWGGAAAVVFERSRMLTGDPGARMIVTDLYPTDPNLGSLLPADLDGAAPPAGTPNVFAQVDDDAWASGAPYDRIQLWSYAVDWTAPSASFTKIGDVRVAPFDSDLCGGARDCIPQPGTTSRLDAIPDRLMYRLSYRLLGGRPTLTVNHNVDADGLDHAGVRWYRLEQTDGTNWSIAQQGTFAPADGLSRWMGSAAMNRTGDLAIAYSVAGTTRYPSLRHTGRLGADGSAGQMTLGEASIVEGAGSQTATASRWGDYSQLTLDPRDDCTFWYTGEYLATTGAAPWRTRIGSFRLSSCGLPAGALTGRLTDAVSGKPVARATVTIPGLGARTTSAAGDYSFTDAYAGSYVASIAAAGFPEVTAGVTVTSGTTTRLDLALNAYTDTGWLGPTATVPGPGGDGDGYETGASVTAFAAAGGASGSDVKSGTKNSTQCDSTARDRQDFTVPLTIPADRSVTGIRVRLRASANMTSGTPRICVLLSWDAGRTWTDAKMSAALTTTPADYVVGAATDPWQVAKRNRAWTAAELGGLRVRLVDIGSTTSATYVLDALEVNASFR